MSDYTLPPVPDPDVIDLSAKLYMHYKIERYGHACAEHVRGPLAEENAALKARLRSVCQTLVSAVGADGPCDAKDAAVRAVARIAELEAQAVTREMTLQDSAVQLLRTNADRDRLRAEVGEYKADAERYRWIKAQGHKGPFYFSATGQVHRDDLDAAIDAARKGEGSE